MGEFPSVDAGPLVGKLEPEALKHCSDEFSAMVSIAISLKRIADRLESGFDPHGDFTFQLTRAISEGLRK